MSYSVEQYWRARTEARARAEAAERAYKNQQNAYHRLVEAYAKQAKRLAEVRAERDRMRDTLTRITWILDKDRAGMEA